MNPQQTQPQTDPQEARQAAVETALDQIAADSKRDPQQFLDDSVVPHGGE